MTVNGTALSTSDYTVSGMKITIPANKITGNVVITVATEKVNTEPEEPGTGGESGGGSGDDVQSNVSYITRVTNNVNIVDGKSVGNTGGYNEDQNYLSYEYSQ